MKSLGFKNEDRQWDTNFFLQSSFKKNYRKYSFLLSGKYAYDYLHYLSDPRLDVSTMYINNHYRQQEIYLSAANRYFILPFWAVNISTDFQWNKLNADLSEVLLLNVLNGIKTSVISEMLGKPQNTILSWLTKAKTQFVSCLEEN